MVATGGENVKRLHACMTIFVHGAGVMAASGSHLVPDDDICDLLMSDVFQALKAYYKLPQKERESLAEEKKGETTE